MRKIIVIFAMLIFLFVLSGCSFDVNLTINNNYEIKQKAKFTIENDTILLSNNSVKDYLNELITSYADTEYKLKKFFGNNNSGIIFMLGYTDFNSYIKNADFASVYQNPQVDIKDKTLSFASGEGDYDSIFSEGPDPLAPSLDELKINIKFYNEVVESNADSYDKKNNTYTWVITNEKRPESISFKTSKKIRYDIMFKDLVEEYFVSVIIFCVGLSLIIFLFLRFKRRINFNNEV